MEIPTLHTARLTLRPLTMEDAVTLHCINQTVGVLQYFPNTTPPPLEANQRFVTHALKHWEKFGYGNWGITVDSQPEIIGWAGLEYLAELNETEVGFLLDRPFWGKGYATEAALASLDFAFKTTNLDHLIALVHPQNLASQRVLEKCGLSYQETLSMWGIELQRYRMERP